MTRIVRMNTDKMMKRWLGVILVVAAMAIALAVLIPDHETAGLGGTSWRLVAYGPADAPTPAEAPATIRFEGNSRFSGHTGCNGFFGNYRAAEGRLAFVDDEVAFTTAGCPPETAEGAQDAFFRAYFVSGMGYLQIDDELLLQMAEGRIAEFVRE